MTCESTCALPQARIIQVRTMGFMTQLRLGLGLNLVLFALLMNVESGVAEVCL